MFVATLGCLSQHVPMLPTCITEANNSVHMICLGRLDGDRFVIDWKNTLMIVIPLNETTFWLMSICRTGEPTRIWLVPLHPLIRQKPASFQDSCSLFGEIQIDMMFEMRIHAWDDRDWWGYNVYQASPSAVQPLYRSVWRSWMSTSRGQICRPELLATGLTLWNALALPGCRYPCGQSVMFIEFALTLIRYQISGIWASRHCTLVLVLVITFLTAMLFCSRWTTGKQDVATRYRKIEWQDIGPWIFSSRICLHPSDHSADIQYCMLSWDMSSRTTKSKSIQCWHIVDLAITLTSTKKGVQTPCCTSSRWRSLQLRVSLVLDADGQQLPRCSRISAKSILAMPTSKILSWLSVAFSMQLIRSVRPLSLGRHSRIVRLVAIPLVTTLP